MPVLRKSYSRQLHMWFYKNHGAGSSLLRSQTTVLGEPGGSVRRAGMRLPWHGSEMCQPTEKVSVGTGPAPGRS